MQIRTPIALTTLLVVLLFGAIGCATPRGADDGGISTEQLGWVKVDSRSFPTKIAGVSPLAGTGSALQLGSDAPVLVNFWASYCVPCREEMPILERLNEREGIDVVGVSRDFARENARAFLDESGVTYPNYVDSESHLANELREVAPQNALPSSVLVIDGKIEWTYIGAFDSYQSLRRSVLERTRESGG